jgi:putative phosphoserine phosphatase/1-acylglycerol-3-phosphate O-acyltransferase
VETLLSKQFKYVAYYDLDHTILKGNSATHLVEEARKRGVMTPPQYRHAIYLSILYKLNIGDPAKMINRMLSWLRGLRLEFVHALCNEVFAEKMVHTIRPEILHSMQHHRNNGGAVVLLSSATSPICDPVSRHLKLDDLICTQLQSENGVLTGKTSGKLVYGKEKRHRLLLHCEEHEFDPEKAYYYGDSHTDIHVMKAVGFPVAVSPDRKLLRAATSRQWPVLVQDR